MFESCKPSIIIASMARWKTSTIIPNEWWNPSIGIKMLLLPVLLVKSGQDREVIRWSWSANNRPDINDQSYGWCYSSMGSLAYWTGYNPYAWRWSANNRPCIYERSNDDDIHQRPLFTGLTWPKPHSITQFVSLFFTFIKFKYYDHYYYYIFY